MPPADDTPFPEPDADFDLVTEAFEPVPQGPPAERPQPLRPMPLAAFLALRIPPRLMLLGPVLPMQAICMLYGPRGLGKTHVALGMALAVATGTTFLRWTAPEPKRVL